MYRLYEYIDSFSSSLKETVFIIGLLCALYISIKFICKTCNGFNVFVFSRFRNVDLVSKYGEVAVITGATDGIGLEFAKQFAQRGHSIIIIGRNDEKLKNSREMVSKFLQSGKFVKTIKADLNTNDASVFYNIRTQLNPFRQGIGILMNNAGIASDKQVRYMEMEEEEIMQMMRVNVNSILMVTRMVLPFMIENKKGLIINMSSITSLKPIPFIGVYSAGKEFINYFSRSLGYEYKKYNIDVQTFVPGLVVTKLISWSELLSKPTIFVPSTKAFVKSAIKTIGHTHHTTGYWSHGLQWTVAEFLPTLLCEIVVDHLRHVFKKREHKSSIV